MSTDILKLWFNEYLESGDGKGWRKDYESTFKKVQEIKHKLNNGYKLSAQNDFEFLSELLKNDANGVASKGQSNLANEVFYKIIQDVEFLNVVEKLIQQPNEETYKALHSYGSQLLAQLGSTKRPLLFNRACASCTLDVSTIVDRNKFHQFVEYVTAQQIIDFPQEIREKNWYVQNIYLVQQVREILKAELESGQTDIFWLNMFLWDIYAEKVATNFNAKNAIDYLVDRYPNTYTSTKHIAAFKTSQGRELALDPKAKTPVIFCDAEPPVELKLPIKKAYSEDDTRNHHLSTHAKSMMVGKKAYSIIVSTLDDLEKLCDWYEQSGDQTTALEKKVQQFLKLWPIENLNNLSIEDYHQAKNTNCFIAQIDSFDPTQGDPTFANYFDIWEPISLGKDDKYYNEKPYSWHKRLGDNAELAFETLKQEILNIVDAVQRRDLKAIDAIQFPKRLKWMIAFLYQDFNDPLVIPIVSKVNTKRIGYEHLYPKSPLPEFLPVLLKDRGEQAFFPYVEKLFAMVRKGYLDNKQKTQQTKELMDEVMNQQPLNRILFGAAGTGKTFHSINHALSILENKPLEVLEKEDRTALKVRFDQYKEQGQIKFVTFHQSFSYEDFVEGIRAETDEHGSLTYNVKSGVFKEICEDAELESEVKSSKTLVPTEASINQVIESLIQKAKLEEQTFYTKRNVEFKVTSNASGTLFAQTSKDTSISLSLRHIKNYLKFQSKNIVDNRAYEWAIANSLSSEIQFEDIDKQIKPYVLIVDEINRGNISRIFGELITLIEDSKRQGAEEELSVTLPYSKEEFSVPSNVYIIGTMNSSDRSLTGLDIALRRRFTFVEMPPKPELLNDIEVEGLNIGELLKIINERIEVLLDRDHCIGHANFMSLKKQPTLEYLAAIFKQKIIPQLQEYFFDDWAKINMVLNANGMLKAKPVERSVLFPNVESDSDELFEEQKTWQLNDTAFDSIASFSKIIKH
ncbi:AAA family ATPase [Acinetobacter radioresistens]|uniref:McrB family protein n=1 Tax=Acinetobacter TaxID=469 RepID=UPI002897F064|nr:MULTISPECIES: AAA family ATPase [Acinetobacter]